MVGLLGAPLQTGADAAGAPPEDPPLEPPEDPPLEPPELLPTQEAPCQNAAAAKSPRDKALAMFMLRWVQVSVGVLPELQGIFL
jgi:hypothetical protein